MYGSERWKRKMIANHIHDALEQVKTMQEMILEKRLFKGYSGWARIISGSVALIGSVVMTSSLVPRHEIAHLMGWGVVVVIALILNYGALGWWFLFDPRVRGNLGMVKPAIDAVPPLAVGAGLSVAVILRGDYDPLFGIWMCNYGLVHCAHRHSLPRGIYFTGIFYLFCGAYCLVSPAVSFLSPWPMGVVFCIGEFAGGIILLKNREETTKEKTCQPQ